MVKDKMSVTDSVTVEKKTEEPAPEPKKPAPAAKSSRKFEGADLVPSNWHLTPTEKGVEGFNTITNNKFEGSVKEFNSLLKG